MSVGLGPVERGRSTALSEIVILGSGAGFATKDRFSTSIAVCHDDQIYVFDCGEPCSALMFREGLNPLAVRGIFISHMHPDHVGGLAPLLFSMYLPGRATDGGQFRPWSVSQDAHWYSEAIAYPSSPVVPRSGLYGPVSLHVPTEAVGALDTYLPAVYLAPEILPFELRIEGLHAGTVYDDDSIVVRALPNTHLSANAAYEELPVLYKHMSLESYSFSFDVAGSTVVYSGDITALAELDPLLADADVVIVEVAHFDPAGLADALGDCSARSIVLSHIHPGLEEATANAMKAWGDPRVQLAFDGIRIRL